jgi:hypothetical protein
LGGDLAVGKAYLITERFVEMRIMSYVSAGQFRMGQLAEKRDKEDNAGERP